MDNFFSFISKNKIFVFVIFVIVLIISIIIVSLILSNNKKDKNESKFNQCILTFDSNGGSKLESLNRYPEKEGFTFIGGNYMSQPFQYEEIINEDINIVADYMPIDESKIIVVSFETDGGTGIYTYHYTVYKDGIYIGDYSRQEMLLSYASGSYRIDYTVTDSNGKNISGFSTTTIS